MDDLPNKSFEIIEEEEEELGEEEKEEFWHTFLEELEKEEEQEEEEQQEEEQEQEEQEQEEEEEEEEEEFWDTFIEEDIFEFREERNLKRLKTDNYGDKLILCDFCNSTICILCADSKYKCHDCKNKICWTCSYEENYKCVRCYNLGFRKCFKCNKTTRNLSNAFFYKYTESVSQICKRCNFCQFCEQKVFLKNEDNEIDICKLCCGFICRTCSQFYSFTNFGSKSEIIKCQFKKCQSIFCFTCIKENIDWQFKTCVNCQKDFCPVHFKPTVFTNDNGILIKNILCQHFICNGCYETMTQSQKNRYYNLKMGCVLCLQIKNFLLAMFPGFKTITRIPTGSDNLISQYYGRFPIEIIQYIWEFILTD